MNRILVMIHSSLELYETLCRPVCQSCQIPQTALDIILFLANNPEYCTAKDICRIRGIRANVVSFHVEKLVQEGYLIREAVPEDRRKVRLICTEKAEGIVEQGRAVQRKYYEILTEGITPDDQEAFRRCMDQVQKNIEKAKKE